MSDLIAVAVIDLKAGAALDWAVAKAVGEPVTLTHSPFDSSSWPVFSKSNAAYQPSTDWATGGPLIDEYNGDLVSMHNHPHLAPKSHSYMGRLGNLNDRQTSFGTTALEAICKAIVAAKFGDAVTVPRELVEVQS